MKQLRLFEPNLKKPRLESRSIFDHSAHQQHRRTLQHFSGELQSRVDWVESMPFSKISTVVEKQNTGLDSMAVIIITADLQQDIYSVRQKGGRGPHKSSWRAFWRVALEYLPNGKLLIADKPAIYWRMICREYLRNTHSRTLTAQLDQFYREFSRSPSILSSHSLYPIDLVEERRETQHWGRERPHLVCFCLGIGPVKDGGAKPSTGTTGTVPR